MVAASRPGREPADLQELTMVHTRKAVPKRKSHRRSPHTPVDPVILREKPGFPWGGLLVGGAGTAFVAYVWNFGGLKLWLDDTFGGLNSSVHTHDQAIATGFIAALPWLGLLFAVTAAYLLVASTGGRVSRARKRRRMRRTEAPAAPVAAAPARASRGTSDSFIRPVRLATALDESVVINPDR